MQRRIEQLLNGIFEYESGSLIVEPQTLELESPADGTLHGSFTLTGGEGQKVHGFLYPSNARMTTSPIEFQGIENEIRYQFDCSGLKKGTQSSGTIVICSDCGEYELPYKVQIAAAPGEEELPFSTLSEFAALAKSEEQEAYRCFVLPGFSDLLKEHPQLLSLYEGLRAAGDDRRNMEEFLTGAGLKEPVEFSLETTDGEKIPEEGLNFGELKNPEKEQIRIRKSTWGFREIQVDSDALFVRPERKEISSDDFAGSEYDLNLILDTNLMHQGINYARLTVRAGWQTICFTVTARRAESQTGSHQGHVRKIMIKELENLYISFRLQKIEVSAWITNSISAISGYKRAGGNDVFADLYLIQLYFTDNKKKRACDLLEEIEAHKDRLNTVERYCYYLYISTFFYHEASYMDQVEAEVSSQLFANQTSWPLLWILFYLQENYLNDPSARYEAVAEQFQSGCRSRILYVEAWQALKDDPFLMRHLGEFELHLLRFADQEKAMTAEILRQVANLTMHQRTFDKRLFTVLSNGWHLYPSQDLIQAICQYLIRTGKRESQYFEWYALGVENGLRMNGLYEAYMDTMQVEEVRFQDLPQIIRMYFSYNTSLDYRRRSALYRSISDERDSDPQTWYNLRPAIEHFTMEQLERGHLTKDLAVLYCNFLRENMLTEELAQKLVRLLFTYEVTCSNRGISQVVVYSARAPKEQNAHLVNGKAKVQIYDPDSALLAVDEKGRFFESSRICTTSRVFASTQDASDVSTGNSPDSVDKLLAWCAKKVPENHGLVLFLCAESQKAGLMNENLLPYFLVGCEWRGLSVSFRNELRRTVLGYYMAHPRDNSLPEFLDQISYSDYAQVDKTTLITLLAEEGRCTEAFSLLDVYGAEDIPLMQLVRICSRMVLELEFEENAMLLSLCRFCFDKGKFDDKLLRYLILYYEGSVESMKQVWRSACRFGLDTMMLEDKIMMMMLFTREGTKDSEPIFESYVKKMGRVKLCRAYANLKSYEYFVKGVPVADPVFTFIENEYRKLSGRGNLDEQEEVCRLALLQHYARTLSLTDTQRTYAAQMLEEFNAKNMRFSFFKRFDPELTKDFWLQGHEFAEYVCNPASEVFIQYRTRKKGEKDSEEPFREEPVPDRFEGVFVREFILFEGDEIECRFVERNGREEICSDQWVLHAGDDKEQTGRYGILNRICSAANEGDDEETEKALDSWLSLDYLSREMFTLL